MTCRNSSASTLSAFLLLLSALGTATPAHADPSNRVLIVAVANPSGLLEEGLVRVRGELAAMGLSTEVRLEGSTENGARTLRSPEFQGALVFEHFGDWLRIQAWNPTTELPVTQWVDASDPAVDAEVLAVRAVEALRAALLPYSRRGDTPGTSPSTPAGTTLRPPAEPALDASKPTNAPTRANRSGAGHLWVGPVVGIDPGASTLQYGLTGGYGYRLNAFSAGLRLEGTRTHVAVEKDAGEVHVTRLGASLDGRLWLAVARRWELFAGVGLGVVHHRVQGVAAPGYTGATGGHTSPFVALEGGATYGFGAGVSAYVGTRGSVATDAPVVRINRSPVATLERPQLSLSGGLLLSLD